MTLKPFGIALNIYTPLGGVIEAYPGDDGLVRVEGVKAKNKEYLRPVYRQCPLEYVEDSTEESESLNVRL